MMADVLLMDPPAAEERSNIFIDLLWTLKDNSGF